MHAKFHAFVTPEVQAAAFAQEHNKLIASLGGADSVTAPGLRNPATTRKLDKPRATEAHVDDSVSAAVSSSVIPGSASVPAVADGGSAMVSIGTTRTSRPTRRLSAVLLDATLVSAHIAADAAGHVVNDAAQLLDFNVLETALLSACTAILLSGMVFKSAALEVGGPWYVILTVVVVLVVIVSIGLFSWMLAIEIRRSCAQRRQTALTKKLKAAHKMTENPVRKLSRRLTRGFETARDRIGSVAGRDTQSADVPATAQPGTTESDDGSKGATAGSSISDGGPSVFRAGTDFFATAARRERLKRMGAGSSASGKVRRPHTAANVNIS